jgi:hypothetical protein
MASNSCPFLLVLAVLLFVIRPVAAQSIYAAGSLGADIVLASGQESIGFTFPTGGGESLSGAARLGVLLEPRWGIELEVSRAGEIRETSQPNIAYAFVGGRPAVAPETEHRTRVTTISATASIRQHVSDTVALAYLGGIVFHRTDSRIDYRGIRGLSGGSNTVGFDGSGYTISGIYNINPVGLVLPSTRIDTVQYGAGPVVGFEAHIGYGTHFTIIPGIRMHGLPASWLLRPSIAAGWRF